MSENSKAPIENPETEEFLGSHPNLNPYILMFKNCEKWTANVGNATLCGDVSNSGFWGLPRILGISQDSGDYPIKPKKMDWK